MDANFGRALAAVLRHEGGYVNHPSDPGGPTNKGITLATFRKWVKRDGTANDLKRITDDQVAKVYRSQYWNAVKAGELPSGVDYAVFDYAVNSGPTRAAKALQNALGVTADGIIGPVTIAAAQKVDPIVTIRTLCGRRMVFLKQLKTWDTFGKGWEARVSDVRDDAIQMTAAKPIPQPAPTQPPKPTPIPAEPLPPKTSKGMGFLGWTILALVIAAALAIAAFTVRF